MPAFDTSDLNRLAADMRSAPDRVAPKIGATVFKGATKIKAAMRTELEGHRYYRRIAGAVDFDTFLDRDGFRAEIGPRTGSPGSLANIAYFGGSRGGGQVGDPVKHLDVERPHFESALGDIASDIL